MEQQCLQNEVKQAYLPRVFAHQTALWPLPSDGSLHTPPVCSSQSAPDTDRSTKAAAVWAHRQGCRLDVVVFRQPHRLSRSWWGHDEPILLREHCTTRQAQHLRLGQIWQASRRPGRWIFSWLQDLRTKAPRMAMPAAPVTVPAMGYSY